MAGLFRDSVVSVSGYVGLWWYEPYVCFALFLFLIPSSCIVTAPVLSISDQAVRGPLVYES